MMDAGKRPWVYLLGLLVLATVLLSVPAGRRPFWSSDEARQALLGQDIVEHGRWLVPELRGRPYLNKPQLYFWSIALVSRPAGRVTELTAVIPSILSAIAGVAGVSAVGRLLWGWPTGLLAGLLLTATLYHFEIGHQVLPDIMLNAWMVWALYAFLRAERAGWSARWLAVFYGCVAGGLLTKGPPALAVLVAAGVVVARTDGVRALGRLRPLAGVAVLAVTALVWLVPYHLQSHGAFAGQVVRDHYLAWFFRGGLGPRLANLASALPNFFPWVVLLAGAAVWWRACPDPGRRRVLLWTLSLWLLVGASGNFRSRYLLPVYPGFALLAAHFVTAAAATREGRGPLRVAMTACALLALGAAVLVLSPATGLITGEDRAYVPVVLWERALMAALAAAGGAAMLAAVRREAYVAGTVALALAVSAVLLVEGIAYPGRYARAYDVRPIAAAASARLPAGGVVVGHPDLRLSYDFYLRRPVREIPSRELLAGGLAGSAPGVVITTRDRWSAVASLAAAPDVAAWGVVASARVGERDVVVVGPGPR
jgi:4-amino-4-deoxy-L-arabinose transferase-like glycosyltransferase